jgi:hypothetical protein
MPRPRKDGTPRRKEVKRELKPLHLQKPPPPELQEGQQPPSSYLIWDTEQPRLAMLVRSRKAKPPKTISFEAVSFKVIYSAHGRVRWYTIDKAVGLSEARKRARKLIVQVDDGMDPQAGRKFSQDLPEPSIAKPFRYCMCGTSKTVKIKVGRLNGRMCRASDIGKISNERMPIRFEARPNPFPPIGSFIAHGFSPHA